MFIYELYFVSFHWKIFGIKDFEFRKLAISYNVT